MVFSWVSTSCNLFHELKDLQRFCNLTDVPLYSRIFHLVLFFGMCSYIAWTQLVFQLNLLLFPNIFVLPPVAPGNWNSKLVKFQPDVKLVKSTFAVPGLLKRKVLSLCSLVASKWISGKAVVKSRKATSWSVPQKEIKGLLRKRKAWSKTNLTIAVH